MLVWAHAITLGQGSQRLVLVPMAGDQALFATRPWQGTRYLVVARNTARALNGNVLELLLRRASTPIDTLALFSDLYKGFVSGRVAAPAQVEGLVMLYSADYHYLTGRQFRNGQLLPGTPRLIFLPYDRNGRNKNKGTSPRTPTQSRVTGGNVCTDWYNGTTGAYITTTGDCTNYVYDPNPIDYGDSGGINYGNAGTPADVLSGPSGYGGTSGGSGSGPGPTSIPKMPQKMPKQLGVGGCVPASLTQVKLALCGGVESQIEGSMFLYGMQQYGTSFPNDGVPLSGMSAFVNNFFTTTALIPAGNFQGAINAGHPIMVDMFAYMDGPNTKVYHSVVVTGYDPNNVNQVYYLDPGTGTTETTDAASLFAGTHYAIPITGCK